MDDSFDHSLSRRAALRAFGLTVAGLVTAACGGGSVGRAGTAAPPAADGTSADFSARFARYESADEPNGDLAKVVWPPFVTRAGSEVQRLYEFQVTHGELMKYMPCFCGCHEEDGHRNNRDCYVERVNADGSVVFDPMAPT